MKYGNTVSLLYETSKPKRYRLVILMADMALWDMFKYKSQSLSINASCVKPMLAHIARATA